MAPKQFDVIILGSGLAGSILATILAKHGARVLVIDKNAHPRFAIGEAMTPDTDLMMSILSYQYEVPEIAHLSSFENICNHISPSACGLKRSFNFVYHREGQAQNLQETNKLGVHPSSHLFRQDIDLYMANVAVQYGVQLLENTRVIDLSIDRHGVTIATDNNEQFIASYLVDGSGYNSLLTQKFQLREIPTRLKTHSRSIFTHMVGVKRYDDCVPTSQPQDELRWYQGTLHHIFDGGWMWVIPFNNHDRSANPVCSIGLNLDSRRFPKTDTSPEQEFQAFLARFPSIATQFEDAKPVRNWVSTGRLQYSSHRCMGDRFYLLPHAAGFIDPLYSFGLVNSCITIVPLAARLLKAIANKDFSANHFTALEELQQKLLNYNDDLVHCSYIAFSNYNLWNAWRRIWILGSSMRQAKAGLRKRLKISAGKGVELASMEDESNLDYLTPSYEGLGDDFFRQATTLVEQVEAGLRDPNEAAQQVMSLIQSIDFLPNNFYGLGDASQRDLDVASKYGIAEQKRFLFWIKSSSKSEVKRYFDYDIDDLLAAAQQTAAGRS
ncbi:NAD(P)/FAD-dependent oxidoreductase [Chroococcidiopsis sp. CCNUC1]|uniref:NAD(P)/FAD-dependent oxidoreductase n=1 Tax=Chroococcidiopsis sp. CCNUC1 TaxID=2653189 RepID=UPI002020CA74|nr:tryptophan 7-halogenase [Chroococcidiopsis sp. CCNUC1]URD53872.1 tryptophan 7-halogenase [Chroococcidiopsis sp. CCNUC1]